MLLEEEDEDEEEREERGGGGPGDGKSWEGGRGVQGRGEVQPMLENKGENEMKGRGGGRKMVCRLPCFWTRVVVCGVGLLERDKQYRKAVEYIDLLLQR